MDTEVGIGMPAPSSSSHATETQQYFERDTQGASVYNLSDSRLALNALKLWVQTDLGLCVNWQDCNMDVSVRSQENQRKLGNCDWVNPVFSKPEPPYGISKKPFERGMYSLITGTTQVKRLISLLREKAKQLLIVTKKYLSTSNHRTTHRTLFTEVSIQQKRHIG